MNNPFAPVEGHYALLRNGVVMGAYKQNSQGFWVGVASDINIFWKPDGTAYGSDNHGNRRLKPDHDIIATISPADMQALASGELERLRAALKEIVAADDNYKAASNFMKDSFSDGYSDGLHDAAYVARAALAKMEESKSCKS
ncbi:MAG: hypothetical protein ACK5X3_05105 [Pseudomonadota bacterium]|jgi:hypothetical protein